MLNLDHYIYTDNCPVCEKPLEEGTSEVYLCNFNHYWYFKTEPVAVYFNIDNYQIKYSDDITTIFDITHCNSGVGGGRVKVICKFSNYLPVDWNDLESFAIRLKKLVLFS